LEELPALAAKGEQLAIVEDIPNPIRPQIGRFWHSSGFVGNPGGFISAKPFLA
jgi:hypothetical protein